MAAKNKVILGYYERKTDALEALVGIARGDMRRAVNSLQVAASLGRRIDADLIYQTAGHANPESIRDIIMTAMDGDFVGAKDRLASTMEEYGLAGQDVIGQIHSQIFYLDISDYEKVRLLDKVGECEFRIVEGSNERIQLEWLIASMALIGGNLK